LPAASDRPDRSTPSGSPPADTSAPYVPTDLAGTIVAAGRIDLAWSPSSDDVAIAGYNLYRDGLKINTVPIGSTAYSDTGLTPGVSHTYTVTAIDAAANESAPSSGWSGAASDGALLTAYAYDAENRLTGIESGSETLGTYAYDGAGDRVAKTTAAGTTSCTLDLASGLPQVLSETTGSATSTYAYAGGPLELDRAGTTYWYLADTLGSVRLVTDSAGVGESLMPVWQPPVAPGWMPSPTWTPGQPQVPAWTPPTGSPSGPPPGPPARRLVSARRRRVRARSPGPQVEALRPLIGPLGGERLGAIEVPFAGLASGSDAGGLFGDGCRTRKRRCTWRSVPSPCRPGRLRRERLSPSPPNAARAAKSVLGPAPRRASRWIAAASTSSAITP
jgi:YD repeat-containing protein